MLTTEAISAEYLHVNNCGIQNLGEVDAHQVRPHGRLDYHLLYIARGCCTVRRDGRTLSAPEGSLVLFLPGEPQDYAFRGADRSVSCYLHFSGTGCETLLRRAGLWGHAVRYLGKNRAIEALFEQMLTEQTLSRPLTDELLGAYLWQLLSLIGRQLAELDAPSLFRDRSRIDRVCLLMNQECAQNRPLSYYAGLCSLSVSRFSHLFKAMTGLTPLAYLNRARIENAKELLLKTSRSIAEIAEMVGFSGQNYFGRLFRRQVGLSPTEFARTR